MPIAFYAALVLVALGGAALVFVLLRAFTADRRPPLSFVPEDLKGYTVRGLALSSLLVLYLELLLIRWISSEIRIFAYFKNFVLIACFLGFGLGCYLARRAISALALFVPLLFFSALITLPWEPLRRLIAGLPVLLGATSEVQIWGVGAAKLTGSAFTGLLFAALITLPLFALLAVAFIPLGQIVGWYLENAPHGITAYSINVLASLAGIGLYTALCFANQSPLVWFLVAGVLLAALFWTIPRVRTAAIITCLLCAALTLVQKEDGRTFWSPYQKLTLRPLLLGGESFGWDLETNGSWYQKIIDLSPAFVARHPEITRDVPIELNSYNLPYRFAPSPKSTLVLGSGMGNDVAAALRNGSQSVTAVEIDPLIVELGRELHPERPYRSPRVKVVVDDARSYLQNSREQFDLIVFSLLDSHTTTSHFTNIRIDNYVYTREALQAARRLMAPEGLFIIKFQVQRWWIAARLERLLTEVFGVVPLQLDARGTYTSSGHFFVVGSRPKILAALADPAVAQHVIALSPGAAAQVTVTTDDWPYFYQKDPGLPTSVVVISLLLVVVCVLAVRRVGLPVRAIRMEFLLLGAGFLLLEAQIISRAALLFGTTWIVNSVIIAVLLLLIVAANVLVSLYPNIRADIAYALIVVSIAVAYLIPSQTLLFRSFALRATVAVTILCAPVFFAGIVFIKRFAAAGFSAEAIGSNLIGALLGGIAESISLWSGLRSLLGLAAALYLAAWLVSRKRNSEPEAEPASAAIAA